jgi:hypothetical protein
MISIEQVRAARALLGWSQTQLKEDWYDWAQRPSEKVEYNYKPAKFELSETAKHVFGSAIHFISSLPKL